jgi:hypothetical protein
MYLSCRFPIAEMDRPLFLEFTVDAGCDDRSSSWL